MKKTFLKRLVASVLALSILSGIIGTAVFAEPASADVTPSLRGNGLFDSATANFSDYNYTAAYGKFLEAKATTNKIDISIKPGTVEALEAGTHVTNADFATATKMPIGIIPNGDTSTNMAVVGVAIPKPSVDNANNIKGVKVNGGDVIKLGEGENTGTDALTGKLITYVKFAEYDETKWTSVANKRTLNLVWCDDSGDELYTSKVEINITKKALAPLGKGELTADANSDFVRTADGTGRVLATINGAEVANPSNADNLATMVLTGVSEKTAYHKYSYPAVSGAAAYKIGNVILAKGAKDSIADGMVVDVQPEGSIHFYLPFAKKGEAGNWTALPTGTTIIKLEALSATNAASVFAEGTLTFARKTNNDYGDIEITLKDSAGNLITSDHVVSAENMVINTIIAPYVLGQTSGSSGVYKSSFKYPYGKYEVIVTNTQGGEKVVSKTLIELNSDIVTAEITLTAAKVEITEAKPTNVKDASTHITEAPAGTRATVSGDLLDAVAADSDVNAALGTGGTVAITVKQEIVIPPSNENKEAALNDLENKFGDHIPEIADAAKSMHAALSAIPNNLEPVLAIDINIEAKIDSGTAQPITELSEPLNISLQIPGNIDDSKGFTVYRSHIGGSLDSHIVDPITPSYDKEHRVLTFPSNKFSTFVVVAGKPSSSGIINNSSSKTVTCTVEAKATEGGKIIPEGSTTVKQGEEINYEFLPNPGYEVGAIIVDGVNIGKGRAYNMKKIYDDITLEVQFVKSNSSSGSNTGSGTTVPQTGIAELLPLF